MMEAVTDLPGQRAGTGLEAFHGSSWGWALACCLWDRSEAEEVLQTAYLKALDGRARFDGHSSERTWFFGVIRRTAVEHRRRHFARRLALRRCPRIAPGQIRTRPATPAVLTFLQDAVEKGVPDEDP